MVKHYKILIYKLNFDKFSLSIFIIVNKYKKLKKKKLHANFIYNNEQFAKLKI